MLILLSIQDALRNLSLFFDNLFYRLLVTIYNMFFYLSDLKFLTDETIQTFTNRIYVLVGIFMLFKLAITLLTYIADPDKMNDKKAGGGKLIQNIIVTLVLLAVTPFLFTELYSLQAVILKSNVIPKLILGVDSTAESQTTNSEGDRMAIALFSGFYSFDGGDPLNKFSSVGDMFEEVGDQVNETTGWFWGQYTHEYNMFISTIAGIFVCYVLFAYCFDTVIRAMKLTLLQMIAPIPILTNLAGNSDILQKWAKLCMSTFFELFLRLAVIYFGVYVINKLNYVSLTTGEVLEPNLFYKAVIIVGIFGFVQSLPKLIEEVFGIKMAGDDFGFKAAGIVTAGAALGATAASRGMIGAAKTANAFGEHGWTKAKHVIGAGLGGAATGLNLAGSKGSFMQKIGATRSSSDKYTQETLARKKAVADNINAYNKTRNDLADKDDAVMSLQAERDSCVASGDAASARAYDNQIKQAKAHLMTTGYTAQLQMANGHYSLDLDAAGHTQSLTADTAYQTFDQNKVDINNAAKSAEQQFVETQNEFSKTGYNVNDPKNYIIGVNTQLSDATIEAQRRQQTHPRS